MPRSKELGKLVEDLCAKLSERTWVDFIQHQRGCSCLAPGVGNLPHPAAKLLDRLRIDGAPVSFTTADWDPARIVAAIERGAHQSAKAYQGFLEADMGDMIPKEYWIVLPFDRVKDLNGLRISPIGVVPQRDRRPRIIVDYSFSGVNQETDKHAPVEAMQFGRALSRILHAILTAPPQHGTVYLLKIDLSDGFYRVQLRPSDVAKLGVALPTRAGEPRLVAFPLVLPMGWTESPPYFCAATETITDLANHYGRTAWSPPLHPLEHEAACAPPPPDDGREERLVTAPNAGTPRRISGLPARRPLQQRLPRDPAFHVDVFVDDEIAVAQGPAPRLNRLRRQLLHINDQVFRPNDPADSPARRETISLKKLRKGDAAWSTRKTILGWNVDTIRKTLELPPHRQERLLHVLSDVQNRKRISVRAAHKLVGELRSMLLAVSGGAGLLSNLQHALTHAKNHRVRLTRATRDQLADLLHLARDVTSRPTRIAELFPTTPGFLTGATDAAKSGFGGVIPPPRGTDHPPIVWRVPLPPDLQARLVSDSNPAGDITNSDLELAATVMQEILVAEAHDVAEQTVNTCCDNTPAVAWRNKGSATTTGPAAYPLRLASLLQRRHRHVPRVYYIPGRRNVLAETSSPTSPRAASICPMPISSRSSHTCLLRQPPGKCATSRPNGFLR